ncbi:hypothetical protein L228DRAFT_279535 [Xylona heveae TC161]|uniref:Thioesterase domain-containing protein n=1 Tax=Xylona heveae (strain CBS 132557 / TC161) TaxID=1328760 RepID=A0A165JJH9_XYLHT|nr:hypothetical protein L228DRAFT_279535 [Xylona heveae TC161]KZF26314.1 hypothetical protein L228DRAFT_279535 [Xylona heveae TC161]
MFLSRPALSRAALISRRRHDPFVSLCFKSSTTKGSLCHNLLRSNHVARFFATATSSHATQDLRQSPTVFWRILGFCAISIVFTTAGFAVAAAPVFSAIDEYLSHPSDAETLSMFKPYDEKSSEVDQYIKTHPLAVSLRKNPALSESRPHFKIPSAYLSHNFTSGTLAGERKIVVPPYAWTDANGDNLTSITYLGPDVCGHSGIVHGGLLATILDEGLARCCFPALPNKVGLTAKLNINYRNPALAGSFVVLKAKTVKTEGRKAWVEGRLETLAENGKKSILLAEADALFVEPKQAAAMARFYS